MPRNEIKQAKQSGGAFPNEETFQEIYEECLDNQPQASEATRSSYKRMGEIFDQYLCAIQEDVFRYAYQCGYRAAMSEMQKGGAA